METLDFYRIGRGALLGGISLALSLSATSVRAGDTAELREQDSIDAAIHPRTVLFEDLVPIGGGIIQLGAHGILDEEHPGAVLTGEVEFSGDRPADTVELLPQGILDEGRSTTDIPRHRPEGVIQEDPEFREPADDIASGPVAAVTPPDFEIRAYPNPSFGPVAIEAGSTRLTVDVYDVSGRKVVSLTGASGRTAWDGRDDRGQTVSSGVYFARVTAPQDGIQKTVRLVRN